MCRDSVPEHIKLLAVIVWAVLGIGWDYFVVRLGVDTSVFRKD